MPFRLRRSANAALDANRAISFGAVTILVDSLPSFGASLNERISAYSASRAQGTYDQFALAGRQTAEIKAVLFYKQPRKLKQLRSVYFEGHKNERTKLNR